MDQRHCIIITLLINLYCLTFSLFRKLDLYRKLSPSMVTNDEIFADYSPIYRVYKNGRVERMKVAPHVPPSFDRNTGVQSKDKLIFPETGVSVRIFNPIEIFQENRKNPTYKKMPILMYCHGGSFCIGSTFSRMYHNFLNRLACEAQVIVVSVEYRKATEHPLPAAYNDCWDALLWIFSHDPDNCWGQPRALTKDAWLDPNALDFNRVYLAGDSTGANIAHQVALRAGVEGLGKALDGLILIHPVFWGKDRIGNEVSNCKRVRGGVELGDKVWGVARWGSPDVSVDDPWFNPAKDPKLSLLGCRRVLICIAKLDVFRDRGLLYGYILMNKGWVGDIVIVETDAEDHAFHLRRPSSPNTKVLLTKIVDFVNSNPHAKL